MHFGGAMFFTDYSMSAPELARALEERGFESVWAPEHSHIPLSRKTPVRWHGRPAGTRLVSKSPRSHSARISTG
jgi:alkanesulfonate monooxygenase SsuD/methylene tetrahydromethanopterin reductase-like flavin-dependent oxidoreductase (luciferase family)